MHLTDEELVELWKDGDNDSFQQLMNRYLKQILNFVFQYVRSTEEAEDTVQDTFLKAWKNLGKFKTGKKWKPWIYTIARNTALDYIKRRKTIPFSSLDNENNNEQFSETLEDTEILANQIFEQTQNIQELSVAMSKLCPEYHSVLILHYQEEMTFEEISAIMDTPMNTVKSWHRRALEQIKTLLQSQNAPK